MGIMSEIIYVVYYINVCDWLDFIGRTGVWTRRAPGVDQSRDRFILYAVYLLFSFFGPVYKMALPMAWALVIVFFFSLLYKYKAY